MSEPKVQTVEARFAQIGARIDPVVDRLRELLDGIERRLEDLEVQASLAKLETRERAEPVVEEFRNRLRRAHATLDELGEAVRTASDALRVGVGEAGEDLEAAVDVGFRGPGGLLEGPARC